MQERSIDVMSLLEHIDPSTLNYQEWVNVGMALKHEGFTADAWEEWSSKDGPRYKPGECYKKWDTFIGSNSPVTGGTIVQYAKDQGYVFASNEGGHELGWDDTIHKDDLVVVDKNWVEGQEIKEPKNWNPTKELITYLETLFDSTEYVGYVTRSYETDGKHVPTKGNSSRTAGELIQELNKYKDDIGAVLGDYSADVGAWIRFNPLDGKGIRNDNVTDYRYALVESDAMEIEKQNAIIRELELPVACLVYSGAKSVHAIVKIEAGSYDEYRKRVNYLYDVCKKNGLDIDTQNRNPSRLSRMPGVIRKDKKQFLIDTNIGQKDWNTWYEWIEGVNDDLPEPESLESVWDNLPELSPPLLDGILRQGHKLLLAGPSKAGKSFALAELCISIAEGIKWLGFNCTKGKIMYVNLELDRASCLHRFKDIYRAMDIPPNNVSNIDIWNLRGKSIPMDKLAPKLIRRASKKGYIAIIIDPIYKVITGDENSADQMANFCNQFDKVCTELGCAVIYCHHHSKGSQGGKRSMDRASGSGVFARDPDALIDLIELELNDNIYAKLRDDVAIKTCLNFLSEKKIAWWDDLSQDDVLLANEVIKYSKGKLREDYLTLERLMNQARDNVTSISGWRIEATLREYPKFKPINLWFKHPVHEVDEVGILSDINPDEVKSPWQKAMKSRKTPEEKKKDRLEAVTIAYQACSIEGEVTLKAMAEYMGITDKTVRNRLKEAGGFWIDEGKVGQK